MFHVGFLERMVYDKSCVKEVVNDHLVKTYGFVCLYFLASGRSHYLQYSRSIGIVYSSSIQVSCFMIEQGMGLIFPCLYTL